MTEQEFTEEMTRRGWLPDEIADFIELNHEMPLLVFEMLVHDRIIESASPPLP